MADVAFIYRKSHAHVFKHPKVGRFECLGLGAISGFSFAVRAILVGIQFFTALSRHKLILNFQPLANCFKRYFEAFIKVIVRNIKANVVRIIL